MMNTGAVAMHYCSRTSHYAACTPIFRSQASPRLLRCHGPGITRWQIQSAADSSDHGRPDVDNASALTSEAVAVVPDQPQLLGPRTVLQRQLQPVPVASELHAEPPWWHNHTRTIQLLSQGIGIAVVLVGVYNWSQWMLHRNRRMEAPSPAAEGASPKKHNGPVTGAAQPPRNGKPQLANGTGSASTMQQPSAAATAAAAAAGDAADVNKPSSALNPLTAIKYVFGGGGRVQALQESLTRTADSNQAPAAAPSTDATPAAKNPIAAAVRSTPAAAPIKAGPAVLERGWWRTLTKVYYINFGAQFGILPRLRMDAKQRPRLFSLVAFANSSDAEFVAASLKENLLAELSPGDPLQRSLRYTVISASPMFLDDLAQLQGCELEVVPGDRLGHSARLTGLQLEALLIDLIRGRPAPALPSPAAPAPAAGPSSSGSSSTAEFLPGGFRIPNKSDFPGFDDDAESDGISAAAAAGKGTADAEQATTAAPQASTPAAKKSAAKFDFAGFTPPPLPSASPNTSSTSTLSPLRPSSTTGLSSTTGPGSTTGPCSTMEPSSTQDGVTRNGAVGIANAPHQSAVGPQATQGSLPADDASTSRLSSRPTSTSGTSTSTSPLSGSTTSTSGTSTSTTSNSSTSSTSRSTPNSSSSSSAGKSSAGSSNNDSITHDQSSALSQHQDTSSVMQVVVQVSPNVGSSQQQQQQQQPVETVEASSIIEPIWHNATATLEHQPMATERDQCAPPSNGDTGRSSCSSFAPEPQPNVITSQAGTQPAVRSSALEPAAAPTSLQAAEEAANADQSKEDEEEDLFAEFSKLEQEYRTSAFEPGKGVDPASVEQILTKQGPTDAALQQAIDLFTSSTPVVSEAGKRVAGIHEFYDALGDPFNVQGSAAGSSTRSGNGRQQPSSSSKGTAPQGPAAQTPSFTAAAAAAAAANVDELSNGNSQHMARQGAHSNRNGSSGSSAGSSVDDMVAELNMVRQKVLELERKLAGAAGSSSGSGRSGGGNGASTLDVAAQQQLSDLRNKFAAVESAVTQTSAATHQPSDVPQPQAANSPSTRGRPQAPSNAAATSASTDWSKPSAAVSAAAAALASAAPLGPPSIAPSASSSDNRSTKPRNGARSWGAWGSNRRIKDSRVSLLSEQSLNQIDVVVGGSSSSSSSSPRDSIRNTQITGDNARQAMPDAAPPSSSSSTGSTSRASSRPADAAASSTSAASAAHDNTEAGAKSASDLSEGVQPGMRRTEDGATIISSRAGTQRPKKRVRDPAERQATVRDAMRFAATDLSSSPMPTVDLDDFDDSSTRGTRPGMPQPWWRKQFQALFLPNLRYADGTLGFVQMDVSLNPNRRDMRVLAFEDRHDCMHLMTIMKQWPEYDWCDFSFSLLPTTTIERDIIRMYKEQAELNQRVTRPSGIIVFRKGKLPMRVGMTMDELTQVVVYQAAAQVSLERIGYEFDDA